MVHEEDIFGHALNATEMHDRLDDPIVGKIPSDYRMRIQLMEHVTTITWWPSVLNSYNPLE